MFEERHLSFNKFLDERAEEISKFRDILKLDTKKKGHQALPKSIRRRAMSHNRYRIPSKLRKVFEEQLIKSENMLRLPKCRKHIRKSARLILSYKERHSKVKWLSTHLWAAKRMRMIDYHGYMVAETPNQKAYRSSYRHFMHNCCMIDMSYFQCLTFYVNSQENQLPACISIAQSQKVQSPSNVDLTDLRTERSYDGYLYNKENRLVCPLIAFYCGKQQQNQQEKYALKCFFNPCALQEVKELFADKDPKEYEIGKCKSQLYCLLGPEWQNKLYQAFKIYGFNANIQTLDQLKYNPNNTEFFIPQKQTKTQTVPHISSQISSLVKQNYQTSQESKNIRQQTLKIFEMLKSKNQPTSESKSKSTQQCTQFWSFYQSILSHSQKVNITITTRSKYTHKRKNKMTKQTKKKVVALETKKRQLLSSKNAIQQEDPESASYEIISESLENIKNEIREFFIDERQSKGLNMQDQNKGLREKTYRVNPVLVTSFKKQSLYQGCYILCSDDDSCRIWTILSKLNIKVIGLQELRHITLESQHLSFPQNFPETKSFQNYAQSQAQKQARRIKRLPPSKRINFLKVNSPNPFSSIEKSIISDSHKVFVSMVNRGRCFSNSYIYKLSPKDISMITKELTENGKIGIVLTETTKNKNTNGTKLGEQTFLDYSKEGLQSLEQKLGELSAKRKLIGRILTGGYLYTKSRQGGIGYVTKSVGQDIDELKNCGYVLIRKVTSPHYYLGQITKIYDDLKRE